MKRFRLTALMILVLIGCFAACAYAEPTPATITVNTDTRVTFAEPGDVALFSFTLAQTGRYVFHSFDEENDPYGYLFDDEMERIASNDDYDDYNFRIEETLTAGNTYYLGVRNYGDTQTGGMTVRLERLEGLFVNPGQTFVYCQRNRSGDLYAYAVSDAGGVTWQWYQVTDGQEQAIAGATEPEYFFPPLTENRIYRCRISDAQGQTQTVDYDVRIDPNVTMNLDEEYAAVDYDGSYTYTAKATADYGGLSYCWQWYRLNELTDEWEYLTVSNQARMAATEICEPREYVCRVTDVNGRTYEGWLYISLKNDGFTLTADSPREFNVPAGQEITMKVHPLTDSDPFQYTYYWQFRNPDGEWSDIISNGPTATVAAKYGEYYCYAEDGCGNYTSISFEVTTTSDMTASADGTTELTVAPNTPVTMTVNASSSAGGITYQWYQYSRAFERYLPIGGADSATYAINQAKSTGEYRCKATDAAGMTKTVDYTLEIVNHLSAEPESRGTIYLDPGQTATLKVTADSDDHSVFYRWYIIGEDGERMTRIAGADSNTLTVTGTGRWAYYRCKVYDGWGNAEDFYWEIGFDNQLKVSPEDEEITAAYNGSTTMTVTATARYGELNYRWYRIDIDPIYEQTMRWPVEGAHGNTLTIPPVTRTDYYECVVTDEYGNEGCASFLIRIENGLIAVPDGPWEITVTPTEQATMKVIAGCTTGDVTCQWYRYGNPLEDKTGTSLEIPSATRDDSGKYQCLVTDEYGNTLSVFFTLTVDNNMTLRNLTPTNLCPDHDGTATMTVRASCTVGDVSYTWKKGIKVNDPYGGWHWEYTPLTGTEPSLTVTDAANGDQYVCCAEDDYGSTATLTFYITIPESDDIEINSVTYNAEEPGGEAMVSLSVWSGRGPITYTWYRQDGNEGEETQIEGVTGPQLIIQNVTGPIGIRCVISDGTETTTFGCTLEVDIHLELSSRNPDTKLLGPDETETLTVTATSNDNQLTYQWTKNHVWLENVTGNSLQISGQDEPGYYECTVNASYGVSRMYSFYRATATAGAELALNQTVNAEITEHCRIRAFSFTPAESGTYSFYTDSKRDTYGYLFDDGYNLIDSDDDDGYGANFLITRKLAAGETVYIGVRYYDMMVETGTIPVGVMKGEYRIVRDGGTLYLHEGQSAYLPEHYGDSETIDSAESANGQVLSLDGWKITAGTAGQTTLQTRYNQLQVNYTVIVEDTGVFVLPAALEEIEDEAFSGVPVRYLEVGEAVNYIPNGSFSGTGIHQALFRGDGTIIYDGALGSEPFTIICRENSQAWYYAQSHNCPWLSLE